MFFSKAIEIAGQDALDRRYLRDGKGLCLKAAITPCDTTEECCEHGIHCVVENRPALDAHAAETKELFSAMVTELQSCQTAFNVWFDLVPCAQEIGELTARAARQTKSAKERLRAWPSGGCQELWKGDQELDVHLGTVCQLAARLVTWVQDTRAHVCYIDIPIQVAASQINSPPNAPCDDVKVQAAQVAAATQVQSAAPSSTKSRAEK